MTDCDRLWPICDQFVTDICDRFCNLGHNYWNTFIAYKNAHACPFDSSCNTIHLSNLMNIVQGRGTQGLVFQLIVTNCRSLRAISWTLGEGCIYCRPLVVKCTSAASSLLYAVQFTASFPYKHYHNSTVAASIKWLNKLILGLYANWNFSLLDSTLDLTYYFFKPLAALIIKYKEFFYLIKREFQWPYLFV